ncbi:MAG: hypothetical protein V5783_03005 [Pontiella sp.]
MSMAVQTSFCRAKEFIDSIDVVEQGERVVRETEGSGSHLRTMRVGGGMGGGEVAASAQCSYGAGRTDE